MNLATAVEFHNEIARLQAEIELLDAAHEASNSALLVIDSGFKNALSEITSLRDSLDDQTGRAAWHYECLTQCEERVIQRDAEIARLRLAIRRLAEQDATLSVQGGNVTVTMDATLTDAEREAVERAASFADDAAGYCKDHANADAARTQAATLRSLLERTSRAGIRNAASK